MYADIIPVIIRGMQQQQDMKRNKTGKLKRLHKWSTS
jgi:hypothetical protein